MHANNRTDKDNPGDYTIEPQNNFRCPYVGVGMRDENGNEKTSFSTSDQGFYDIGYDMVVNQAEIGCPYSRRHCSYGGSSSGEYEDLDCISNVDPSEVETDINAVYYNRETAKCYVHNSGNWEEVNEKSFTLKTISDKV